MKGKEDALSGKKQDSASANLHQLLSGTHHEPGKNKQKQGKKWAKVNYQIPYSHYTKQFNLSLLQMTRDVKLSLNFG